MILASTNQEHLIMTFFLIIKTRTIRVSTKMPIFDVLKYVVLENFAKGVD